MFVSESSCYDFAWFNLATYLLDSALNRSDLLPGGEHSYGRVLHVRSLVNVHPSTAQQPPKGPLHAWC